MDTIRVFMGGDIYGNPGLDFVQQHLASFITDHSIDFTIINGENATGGSGILPADAQAIFAAGADVITGGNHTFEKRDIYELLNSDQRLLRPQNYPAATMSILDERFENPPIPGKGFCIYEKKNVRFAVLNIQGREHMTPLDCPFKAAHAAAQAAQKTDALLFIDFHAESNEEKEALALFIDGKAAAVCGTHTHVQTADARILPHGTAYITDLGMTGPITSVIGSNPEIAIKRNTSQILHKMESASPPSQLQGLIISIDRQTKQVVEVETVSYQGA